MAREAVLYMRGPFPFRIDQGVSLELVTDAKVVLKLSMEILDTIALKLNAFTGFLDKSSLAEVIGSTVPDESDLNSLGRLILGVDNLLRSSGQTLEELVRSIAKWQGDKEDPQSHQLSVEEITQLQQRLPIIIRPYDGLQRQAKAQQLADATGLLLEDLKILCDLRPVFDETRTAVEGVIPFTLLKVVCKGVDGLPLAFEATLSERQVVDLAQKAEAAVKKLKHLREFSNAKGIPIPLLDMTRVGD